jgi:hypothetical protein
LGFFLILAALTLTLTILTTVALLRLSIRKIKDQVLAFLNEEISCELGRAGQPHHPTLPIAKNNQELVAM